MNRSNIRRPLYGLVLPLVAVAGCAMTSRQPEPLPGARKPEHIVIGPYLQPAGQQLAEGYRVVWWSDVPGPGRLAWRDVGGAAAGAGYSEQMRYEGWYRHSARLPRTAGGVAEFSVSVKGQTAMSVAPPREARFAPVGKASVRIAVFGDCGAGTEAQKDIAARVLKEDPALVLIPGDIVYDSGNWDEYRRRFFTQYAELMASAPFAPALGNHDVGNPAHMGGPYRAVWMPPLNWAPDDSASAPYSVTRKRGMRGEGPVSWSQARGRNYSLDIGKCHIVALDSTADAETMRTLIAPWAKADMAEARRRGQTWLIAYWHHPPYTRGAYRDNSGQWQDIRDIFVPLIREGGVQVVLNGHDHNYQHLVKDGVHYVVTGGGGARLYDVKPEYDGAGQPPLLAFVDKRHSFTMLEQSADGRMLGVRQVAADGTTLDKWSLPSGEPGP